MDQNQNHIHYSNTPVCSRTTGPPLDTPRTQPEPEPETQADLEPAAGTLVLVLFEATTGSRLASLVSDLPGSKSGTTAWYCGPTRIPPPPAQTHISEPSPELYLQAVHGGAAVTEATHHAPRRCWTLNFLPPSSCWCWFHYRTGSSRLGSPRLRVRCPSGLGLSSSPEPPGFSPASPASGGRR